MKPVLAFAALGLLAACTSPAPYEQPVGGVGFGSYSEYQQQREASLNTGLRPGQGPGPVNSYAAPTQTATPGFGVPLTGTGAAVAGTSPAAQPPPSAVIAAVDAVQPGAQPLNTPLVAGAGAAIPAAPATGATAQAQVDPALPVNNAGISDEQEFSAVASRETIETDKARIAANRAQYQQVQPGALPERSGGAGASPIIEYAINAPNKLGQAIYKRSGVSLSSTERSCGKYATAAAAQEAFLKSGGPKRDPKNLDPDGDGFACTWDPTPFQKARG